MHTSHIEDEIS